MYLPAANVMDAAEVEAFLAAHPAGQLITVGPDGRPDATLVPILIDPPAADGTRRLRAHVARANAQWGRMAAGSPGLVIVSGSDTYISPSWYASKAEHGRVVPTWNYSAIHLSGAVTVHEDPDWILDVVTGLTERHENHRAQPWSVDDAPAKYVRTRLRAIVGIEVTVHAVEAKAKYSQNRSEADVRGAIAGLEADTGNHAALDVADGMRAALGD